MCAPGRSLVDVCVARVDEHLSRLRPWAWRYSLERSPAQVTYLPPAPGTSNDDEEPLWDL